MDNYFLQHWNFPNKTACKKFVVVGFLQVTCLYFLKVLDKCIQFACHLLTVLFLINDLLEYILFKEGSVYNKKLIPISRGNTDRTRARLIGLGGYLEYCWHDVGKELRVREIDANCLKHLSVVNDIYSYEKELHTSKAAHSEEGVLCISLQILAREADLRHQLLVAGLSAEGLETPGLAAYVERPEYQMSGNELWSQTTLRYSVVVD
ncbi:hypothetical protein BDV11DRAFT_203750 [Aspergillus similis]